MKHGEMTAKQMQSKSSNSISKLIRIETGYVAMPLQMSHDFKFDFQTNKDWNELANEING